MTDDDDLDSVTDNATPIGETARESAFGRRSTLWRCNTCDGVFWTFEESFIVGLELIDHHFPTSTDPSGGDQPDPDRIERMRRRSEAVRHNLALDALHDASPGCTCGRFGLGRRRRNAHRTEERPVERE